MSFSVSVRYRSSFLVQKGTGAVVRKEGRFSQERGKLVGTKIQ